MRHEATAKERQAEAERANAADVAHAAKEVQLVSEQQRVAQLTTNLQEAGVHAEVKTGHELEAWHAATRLQQCWYMSVTCSKADICYCLNGMHARQLDTQRLSTRQQLRRYGATELQQL